MLYMFKVLDSFYCKVIFILSLIIGYFLTPSKLFYSWYIILSVFFIFVFALVFTCIIHNIKDRVRLRKTQKGSLLSLIGFILGFSAMQFCTIGGVCAMSFGFGIIAFILPNLALNLMSEFSLYILIFSLLLQIGILFYMGCFKQEQKLEVVL